MQKLSHLVDGSWVEHSYPAVFSLGTVGGIPRLVAGSPSGDATPFERLVLSMEPPYMLLYILHTPRGEGEAGRYQSPEFSAQEFRAFMREFGSFLSTDARFDIWAYSPAERATVVWDRHNQIFAYGELARFSSALMELGFEEGVLEPSTPHQHHYWAKFDQDAAAIMARYQWSYSQLRPEDEQ